MSFLSGLRLLRISSKAFGSAIPVRNIRGEAKTETNDDHIFKKLWSKHELIEHLCSNVCYEDENNIIINKPYGVMSRINRTKSFVAFEDPPSAEVAVSDVLPELSERLQVKNLSIDINPERCCSGLTILSKSEEEVTPHKLSYITNQNRIFSYLAVVLGQIKPQLNTKYIVDFKKDERKYDLVNDKGKKKTKGLKVQYSHEVLASSKGVSLIKASLNYNYLHCARLVLATKCLAPVLGDPVYSQRATTLFDVTLPVPASVQTTPKKVVPPEIANLLHLSIEDIDCCPCHIHMYSAMFRMKEKKFVISVPPPEYFVWSCEQLGLEEVREFCRRVHHGRSAEKERADARA